MTFGERLKAERERKGVSQPKLAKAIGVTQSAIAHFEHGRKIPSTATVIDIAKYFGVSLDYLLGDD